MVVNWGWPELLIYFLKENVSFTHNNAIFQIHGFCCVCDHFNAIRNECLTNDHPGTSNVLWYNLT